MSTEKNPVDYDLTGDSPRNEERSMELSDRQVTAWLTNIYQPGALADPAMREVLRAHGRLAEGSDLAVSGDAREFLREMVDRLMPRPDAPEQYWRSYRVLVLSFLEGHSHFTVARLLALSSRQISRERTKAIRLLRDELERSTQ